MKKRVVASTMAVFMIAASLCMTAPTAIYAEEITEEAELTDDLKEVSEELEEAEESKAFDKAAESDPTEESKASDEAAESDPTEESKASDEAAKSAPTEESDDIEVTEESDAVGGKTEETDGSDGIAALSESPYEDTSEITEEETVPLAREAAGEKYTVTFDSKGGSDVPDQTVDAGETATEPDDPVNGNLRFIGWFKDPSLENLYDPETYEYNTFDFNTPVTETTTLTALWGAVFTVEVSGDPNCGQIDITDPDENLEFSDTEPMQSSYTNAVLGLMDTFKVGAKASDGYRFVKWVDKDTKKTYATDEVIEVEITENLNLAAVFEKEVTKATPTAAPTAALTATPTAAPTAAPTATPAPTQAATTTTAPKTSDDTPVLAWFGILLMAALGLGITGERKFRNRK